MDSNCPRIKGNLTGKQAFTAIQLHSGLRIERIDAQFKRMIRFPILRSEIRVDKKLSYRPSVANILWIPGGLDAIVHYHGPGRQ